MAETKTTAAKTVAAKGTTFEQRAAMHAAPAWRPNNGDVLRGTLLGVRVGSSVDYDDYPVLVFELADGTYAAFHAFHNVAKERLSELKPKRGDALAIQYLGEHITNDTKDKPEKDQTTYHLYYIERDGDDAIALAEEYAW